MSVAPLVVDLHQRASDLMQRSLLDVRPDQLTRPTPCDGWTLAELVAHQLGQELGFAGALAGGSSELADWVPVDSGDQAAEVLTQALVRTDAALADFGNGEDDLIWMPEMRPTAALPADIALRAHLLDLAVHSWDIGVSIGHRPEPDDELAEFVLAEARKIPTEGPSRSGPFVDVVPADPDGSDGEGGPFEQALRLCGRRPEWAPPD